MKVLVVLVVLGFLATSATAFDIDVKTCIDCISSECLPCTSSCIPNPLKVKCAVCVLSKCSQCISKCIKTVTMQADFGNGMETREYCECPTVEETEVSYMPQRWRRPFY